MTKIHIKNLDIEIVTYTRKISFEINGLSVFFSKNYVVIQCKLSNTSTK